MKELACKAVSGQECPFVAKGDDDAAAMKALAEHGMEAHGEMLMGMTEEQKAGLEAKMKELLAAQE